MLGAVALGWYGEGGGRRVQDPRDLLDPGIESRSPASGDNSFHLIDMLMIKIMY